MNYPEKDSNYEEKKGIKESMPNNTFRESEKKRFEKRFDEYCGFIAGRPLSFIVSPTAVEKMFKSFLHDSHKRLCEKLVGEIEKLRKPTHENNHQIPLRGTMVYERNFNQCLDKAISIINQTLK